MFKLAQDLMDLGEDFERIAGITDNDPSSDEELAKLAEDYSVLYEASGSAELIKLSGRLLKLASSKLEDEIAVSGGIAALGLNPEYGLIEAGLDAYTVKEAQDRENTNYTPSAESIQKTAAILFG